MAKSMYEIIETGLIEVNHNGEDGEFQIPSWMAEASGKLENEEELALWAEDTGNMQALLHAGIAKTIIDLRAAIRPADVAGEKKGEKVKVSLLKDMDKAQTRASKFEIKPATRPGTGGKTPEQRQEQALKLLKGFSAEDLAKILAKAQR